MRFWAKANLQQAIQSRRKLAEDEDDELAELNEFVNDAEDDESSSNSGSDDEHTTDYDGNVSARTKRCDATMKEWPYVISSSIDCSLRIFSLQAGSLLCFFSPC